MDKLKDATLHQRYFLQLMAAKTVEYDIIIDQKLTGIAKGVGVEFKKKI